MNLSPTIAHELAADRIDRYLARKGVVRPPTPPVIAPPRPVIALSQAAGIPVAAIAEKVAAALDFHVFDREVLREIQEDMHLGDRIIEALDAGKRSALDAWIQGFLQFDARIVGPRSFHHMVSRAIRGISLHGSAVIVGHGSPFILRKTNAFRVRLTAPFEVRVRRRAAEMGGETPGALQRAREAIEEEDEERRRFIRKHFGADIDDFHTYDALFNLRRIDPDVAAGLIVDAYRRVAGSGSPT